MKRPWTHAKVRFFCFRSEVPFFGKFDSKIQNSQLKLKFGTQTNSNMQNSMVIFNFSVLNWKYTFWANLVTLWRCSLFLFQTRNFLFEQIWSKKSRLQFKLKFGTKTNANMQIQWCFSSFLFRLKYLFLGNSIQKLNVILS